MKNKGGLVTISCNKDIHNIIISIKDTGIGMDEATKNKIFTPFFSTARKEGGSGIGTMIMQRVIDLHGGKLIIESKLGVGTEIIFQIPDMSRRKS
ncbi:Alginate biosynthesis sensor protein KinB [bioreactor metagenome]|uniref:histidine kinase n=1 Tax=bioreactor metagenome TaxID=1076179 RepID=A0A645C1G6_9ZZZZ